MLVVITQLRHPRNNIINIDNIVNINDNIANTDNIANITQVRHPRKNMININNMISCYCTVKIIQMLQLRPFKCYS